MDTNGRISVSNRLDSIVVGIVSSKRVQPAFRSDAFERRLTALLTERAKGLSEELDLVRRSARDMLRHGTYKPTGRGKPASEYLLRAAADPATFPRINWPVDVCNYISLMSLLPVSIWDLDKAASERFAFRLGRDEEEYAFNTAGQVIALTDLAVGCEITEAAHEGDPIVNPIKDSMRTKTSEETRRVAACVYAPRSYPVVKLDVLCGKFANLLRMSADRSVFVGHMVVEPGEEAAC